jgi:hypothetical protein
VRFVSFVWLLILPVLLLVNGCAVPDPTAVEKKQAVEILKQFGDAEQMFWQHNSEKIEREIERTQSKVKVYSLASSWICATPRFSARPLAACAICAPKPQAWEQAFLTVWPQSLMRL